MAKAEKVGAFWRKDLPDGRVVYNGHITHNGEKIKLNLWENDKGDNPKRPDLNAVLDTYVPKAQGGSGPDDDSIPF